MKVDKLFAVLVLGGGALAGCGGQPAPMPEDAEKPAEEAPAAPEGQPASAPAAEADGEEGKCAWF